MFFLTKMPTVIAEEHYDRVISFRRLIERIENPTNLSVKIAYGGEVGLNSFLPSPDSRTAA